MKKIKYFMILSLSLIVLAFINVMSVLAIEFHEDGVILEGDSYSRADVYNCTVDVYGGYVGILNLHSGSTVNVHGGEQGHISLFKDVILNYYDGTVGWHPNIVNSSIHITSPNSDRTKPIVNIYGGTIRFISPHIYADLMIIHGYGFNYNSSPTNEGELTGFWEDGTNFAISLYRSQSPYVTLLDTISEQTYRIVPYKYEILPCCSINNIRDFFSDSVEDGTLYGSGGPPDEQPRTSYVIEDYHGESPKKDFDVSKITADIYLSPQYSYYPGSNVPLFSFTQEDVGKVFILDSGPEFKNASEIFTNGTDEEINKLYLHPDGTDIDWSGFNEKTMFWAGGDEYPVDLRDFKIKSIKFYLQEFLVSNEVDETYTRFFFRGNLDVEAYSYPDARLEKVAEKRLKKMEKLLEKSAKFIELNKTELACHELSTALTQTFRWFNWEPECIDYYYPYPPPLVIGESGKSLGFMLNELLYDLECCQ